MGSATVDNGSPGPQPGSPPPPPYAQPTYGRPAKVGSGPGGIRPLSLGDVLDGMFRLLVGNWRAFLLALGPVLAPLAVIQGYLASRQLGGQGLIGLFTNPGAAEATLSAGQQGMAQVWSVALSLVDAVFVIPLTTAITVAIAAGAFLSRPEDAGGALRTGFSRYLPMFAASLLTVLIVLLVVGAPGGLLIAAGFAADGNVALFVLGGVLIFLGALAAVVLSVFWSLASVVIVVERTGPVAGLRRSWQLVRSRFWPVVGYGIVALLVGYLVGQIAVLPFGIPGLLLPGVAGAVLLGVGTLLGQILTRPLVGLALTLIYFDVRIRREGLDLQMAADSLQPQQSPATGWGTTG